MSYAPSTLLTARDYIIRTLGVASAAVGIVGDAAHDGGYHCGSDRVVTGDYSVVESSRDRAGLTTAASALDVGLFSKSINGRSLNLRHFSLWLVEQCRVGASDTQDIREVIYSPDGQTVKRWDRLGKRTSGDDSHRWHTHISYFRDSESRDKSALFRRYVTGDDDVTAKDVWTYDPNRLGMGGVANLPDLEETSTNPTVQPAYALSRAWTEARDAARLAAEIKAELAAAKARDVALLQAVKGLDAAAILAHIDDLAAQDKSRDEALLELVRGLASGGATADQIVDALAARLAS